MITGMIPENGIQLISCKYSRGRRKVQLENGIQVRNLRGRREVFGGPTQEPDLREPFRVGRRQFKYSIYVKTPSKKNKKQGQILNF